MALRVEQFEPNQRIANARGTEEDFFREDLNGLAGGKRMAWIGAARRGCFGIFSAVLNNQLRTGADKGNPTV